MKISKHVHSCLLIEEQETIILIDPGNYTYEEKAVDLKPKIIIPIHDWHWKDIARKNFYQRTKDYLGKFNIDFKALETGEVVEMEI